MTDVEHVKLVSDILRNDPFLARPTDLVRRHPILDGVWVDRRGHVWTSIKCGVFESPLYFLKRCKPFVVTRCRKVGLFDRDTRKHRQVSVGKLVLETWVGLARGRGAYRISPPGDTPWPHPDAPETMCWSQLRPTDDLTVYLAAPQIFDTWIIWPGPIEHSWERDHEKPDEVRKVYLPRRQVRLRDEYQKIAHPQLTEQNQAPMIPVPG